MNEMRKGLREEKWVRPKNIPAIPFEAIFANLIFNDQRFMAAASCHFIFVIACIR
jgi:hypothetical protein